MAIDIGFIIGYGGWLVMTAPRPDSKYEEADEGKPLSNAVLVPAVSGNITRALNVPTINSYFLPESGSAPIDGTPQTQALSPIRVGFGTYQYSGSISYEMTTGMANMLGDNFFNRASLFDVQFYDGRKTCTVRNCAWNNFSISGQPNSAVSVSLGYQTTNGYMEDLDVQTGSLKDYSFDSEDLLVPYWQTGAPGIVDFSLAFDRSITPMYLNNTFKGPSYLKVGMLNVTVQMNTMDYLDSMDEESLVIRIGPKNVTLNKKVLTNLDYNMSTLSDVGMKSYSWSSISKDAATAIYSISDVDERE